MIRKQRPTKKCHKLNLFYRATKSRRHVKVRRCCIDRLIREEIQIRDKCIRIIRL